MRTAPTTVHGVHGLPRLERYDEAEMFESDEEAQLFAALALAYHDELKLELGRLINYLGVAGDDGAYDEELDRARALLTRIEHKMIPMHEGTVL